MRLPTASYNLPSRNPSRLVNVYAQASVGKTPVEVVSFPGIETVTALSGEGRGLHVLDGVLYAVAGETLYDAMTGAVRGSIPGTNRLMMADNGIELVTDTGYLYDGSAVTKIADQDVVPWAAVDFCDGYIVAVEAGTGRFVGSALNDATSWNGLDFATAEGSPDNLVTLLVDHRQVILFGEKSTEMWSNTGAAGFPFERIGGGFIEQGCLARLGATKADHSVYWLADDRTVRRLSGQTAIRVSQHGVESALSAMGAVADCEAFSFTWNGNVFVTFRFPTENQTWTLNVTTGEWSERDSYHRAVWDVVAVATFNGKVYAQHRDGAVGELSDSAYTEFGTGFRREVTFPPVYSGNARQFLSQLDAIMRTGDAPVGVDPVLTLEVSHDGGNTWLSLPPRNMGRFGEYARVVRWNRLGTGRDVVFRLSTSDAVPFHLVSAELS